MSHILTGEAGYLALARDIFANGQDRGDRTGTGTRSVFGRQLRYDLTNSFPLFTTKRIFRPAIVHELLWFLGGDTNIRYLHDNGVNIWDEWADENGDLGPVYGKQWRSWATPDGRVIDQIKNVMESLANNPMSRRHMVTAWNPADVDDMALPPCHCLFQFYARRMSVAERYRTLDDKGKAAAQELINSEGGAKPPLDEQLHKNLDSVGASVYYLDCQLYQRSADLFLGVPFNTASYALLTSMMAQQLNMIPGEFVHTFGDVHIYQNHFDQMAVQLSRQSNMPAPPKLSLNKAASIFDYSADDVTFTGYKPLPSISAPVAK